MPQNSAFFFFFEDEEEEEGGEEEISNAYHERDIRGSSCGQLWE